MLAAINPIRVGAKRTYRGQGKEVGRTAFYVNEPVDVSLERLLFIAGQMLLKLTPQPIEGGTGTTPPEVVLDGVTAGDLTTLQTTRAAYVQSEEEQKKTDTESQKAHALVEQIFSEVRDERIDLQLAADQAFPYTDHKNAVTRRTFHIPEDRPATE